jgi:agmatinase
MKQQVHLTGIKYDSKSSFLKGPAKAPDAIRKVLHDGSSNFWTEVGVDLTDSIDLVDLGNIEVDDYHDIKAKIAEHYREGIPHLFLGGDHSVTFPIVTAISEKQSKEFDILHFDAHTDLYDEFEGDKYSHACPFARIMENGLCKRLVQVGIRTVTAHQREQAERWNVEIIQMKDIREMDELEFQHPVYISLDLDVFDPAYAPGVSHHEPGGLSPRMVLDFLINSEIDLFAADIVELNPDRDFNGMTAAIGAKFIKEFIGKMFTRTIT